MTEISVIPNDLRTFCFNFRLELQLTNLISITLLFSLPESCSHKFYSRQSSSEQLAHRVVSYAPCSKMVYGRILYNSLGKYLLSKTNQLLDYVEVQLDEGGLTPALDGHNHCHDLTSHSSSSCGSISSGRSTPNASCSEASDSDDLTPTNSMTFIPQSSDFTDEGEEETMEQKVLRRCPCTSYHCCGKTGYSTTARVSKKGDQIRISTIHTLRSRNRPNSLVTDYFTSKPIVDSDSESGFSEASDCSGRSVLLFHSLRLKTQFEKISLLSSLLILNLLLISSREHKTTRKPSEFTDDRSLGSNIKSSFPDFKNFIW